jgi:transcriptional regulator with XRE-family HTH domain
MTDPRSFGAWLRRERERRTITLRSIADRTKIGAGLLEALERGDVSRWPGGIYRRAFIRSYADAIGLDADLVVANFERVFPPDGVAPASTTPVTPAEDGMRLALAAPATTGINRAAVKKAGIDVGAIFGFGIAGWIGAGAIGFWCAAAVVAIVLHVSRVLGLEPWAVHRPSFNYRKAQAPGPRAEVLSFAGEQVRLTRRARAQRVLATISAAASSAGIPGRRRAARS